MDISRLEKWDHRFLELAKLVASWSKDPSTQSGAVIVDGYNRVVSVGYNGLPKGVYDDPDILNDRYLKYNVIIHCERNAILFAQRSLIAHTLYTWPFMPCAACASMVIQTGITRVVAPAVPEDSDRFKRWASDFTAANRMFTEAGVELKLYGVNEE